MNYNFTQIKNIKSEFTEICIEHIDIITNNSSSEVKYISNYLNTFLNNSNCDEMNFNIIKTNLINKINNIINIYTFIAQENNYGVFSNVIMDYFSLINKLAMLSAKIANLKYDSTNVSNPNIMSNPNNHSENNGFNNYNNFNTSINTNLTNLNHSSSPNSIFINTLNPTLSVPSFSISTVPTVTPNFNLNNEYSINQNLHQAPNSIPDLVSITVTNSNLNSYPNVIPVNYFKKANQLDIVNITESESLKYLNDKIKYSVKSNYKSIYESDTYDEEIITNIKTSYSNSKNTLYNYFKKDTTNLDKSIKITSIHKKYKSDSNNSLSSLEESIYNLDQRNYIKDKSKKFRPKERLPLNKIKGKEIKIDFKKSFVQI